MPRGPVGVPQGGGPRGMGSLDILANPRQPPRGVLWSLRLPSCPAPASLQDSTSVTCLVEGVLEPSYQNSLTGPNQLSSAEAGLGYWVESVYDSYKEEDTRTLIPDQIQETRLTNAAGVVPHDGTTTMLKQLGMAVCFVLFFLFVRACLDVQGTFYLL